MENFMQLFMETVAGLSPLVLVVILIIRAHNPKKD